MHSIQILRPEATTISQLADGYLSPDMRKNLTVFKMSLNYRCENTSPRNLGPLNSDLSVLQQRNLNNAFAYDLVPAPSVITAALRAARRVNDFPTAVRVFEGSSSCPTFSCTKTCSPLKFRYQGQSRKQGSIRRVLARS